MTQGIKIIHGVISDYLISAENISYFAELPQTDILGHVDLFICHGGLGSIKESIYFGTPLLVFPLDLDWDQYGNGLRVQYNKIGLLGNLDEDQVEEIKHKISCILNDPQFQINIDNIRNKMQFKYSEKFFDSVIDNLQL